MLNSCFLNDVYCNNRACSKVLKLQLNHGHSSCYLFIYLDGLFTSSLSLWPTVPACTPPPCPCAHRETPLLLLSLGWGGLGSGGCNVLEVAQPQWSGDRGSIRKNDTWLPCPQLEHNGSPIRPKLVL